MTDDFWDAVEFYKLGMFEYIVFEDKHTGQIFRLHPKQIQAFQLLNDPITSYIGFGGAARGGKSALIALDAILFAYAYPRTVNLIGRKNLTSLWETTWKTLLRMLDTFGFTEGVDFVYHAQRHELVFANKSAILAKNLELKPKDIEATEFGSLEIVRAYVDQSENVTMKIIEKIGERVGSHYTATEYNLKGKVFEAFNPSNTHTKRRYWIPFKAGEEKKTRKFVRALPTDNPGEEAKRWVQEREHEFKDGTMSKVEYQKQVLGNFDYDDSPNILCSYDSIVSMFTNNHLLFRDVHYLTADIARLGSDYARIGVWKDWDLIEVVSLPISKTTEIQAVIRSLRTKYNIPAHRCIADEDGVGGGVVDNAGIKGYVNNSVPLPEPTGSKEKPQYKNLQTQCLYKLAEKINLPGMCISAELTDDERDEIIEECEQIQSYKKEMDQKLQCKPKKDIKQDIGRSPDWRDMLLLRVYFDLMPEVVVF